MKPLFTIILSLLILSNLRAQVTTQSTTSPKEHRFFAGLSLGPSFPAGKFANKNFNDTTAGLARPGPSLSISAGYMFTRSVGVVVSLGGQENKQDAGAIASSVKQANGDTVSTSAWTNSWKIARIMAGGIFKWPVGGKFFFQAQGLVGVLKTSLPGYIYGIGQAIPNINNPSNYSIIASTAKTPLNWAFCYQANAGLGWRLTKRISLVGDISYSHAAPIHKYDHYLVFTPGGGFYDRGPWQRKYVISSVNLMAGAEIQF
jgi:hypothetical protein